jgi:hypothetical protein
MGGYYYRGKKYRRPSHGHQAWRTVKKIANRVLEATSGNHPGGAEAYVERLIHQYPERPKPGAQAPADRTARSPGETPAETAAKPPAEAPVEGNTKTDAVE